MTLAFDAFLFRELVISILIFFSIRFLLLLLLSQKSSPKKLPPGPKGWPLLGALPLLGDMPHVALANLAKQHGPIMYLKMGTCDTVVASTSDAAKAFLKTLDLNFSNRPTIAGATHLGYNSQDMVFADYGPKWKLLRRLTNFHMLGNKALEEWSGVREFEVKHMVREMCRRSKNGEEVIAVELLSVAITNMVSQVVLSRRIFENEGSDSKEFKDMVVEFMVVSGVNIGDFIPSVSWMDLQGVVGKMKKLHKRFDALLDKMLEEHVRSARERKDKPDLLDFLMANHSEQDDAGEKLSFTNIKALLLNLFTAGTDTSGSIIEWALTEMVKNPRILQKAQQEIDQVVGKDRLLLESDLSKLPYLQAICKETYRLHPSTPLSVPRVASEACHVDSYYIPKDTRLNVNVWAIGRDPNLWDNPLEFNPERFMNGKSANVSVNGVDFELIPFGGGRRVCVGYKMAMVVIEHTLGTLVHAFDWKLPDGVELSMDEAFGLTLQKKEPLAAIVSPRLLPQAYV